MVLGWIFGSLGMKSMDMNPDPELNWKSVKILCMHMYILGPLDLGIHYSVTSYHLFIEDAYSYLFAAV